MDLRHKPELQDRLAAEYVLGTLRGSARARFQRALHGDASLRFAVEAWQSRLAPMVAAVAPVRPPQRVWEAIQARIGAGAPAKGVWDSLAFWRSLGLLSSGAAAALLAAVVLFAPAPAPQIVRVPPTALPEAFLAVLSDPKTRKPVMLVSAVRESDRLVVKRLDPAIVVPGKSLELWALPSGGAPRSLGLVGAQERHTVRMKALADASLGGVPTLAISLEPEGGAPGGAPTGPVLYTGPCLSLW